MQHHVPFAASALPGIETEEWINLLLQITFTKYAEDTAAPAVSAANPVFDLGSLYQLSRENPLCGSLLLHVVTPENPSNLLMKLGNERAVILKPAQERLSNAVAL